MTSGPAVLAHLPVGDLYRTTDIRKIQMMQDELTTSDLPEAGWTNDHVSAVKAE